MPIDQDFPKNHQVIGSKNKYADDEHFPGITIIDVICNQTIIECDLALSLISFHKYVEYAIIGNQSLQNHTEYYAIK